mgnify:CR=1 FL=1
MGGKGLKLCRMHLGVNCEQVFAGRFTPKCILEAIFNFTKRCKSFSISNPRGTT